MVGNYTNWGGITTVTLDNTNDNGSFAGTIADGTGNTVYVVKNGTGTQVFTGTNGYTGTTTVGRGHAQVGRRQYFQWLCGGQHRRQRFAGLRQPQFGTYSGVVSGSGTVTRIAGGTLTVTAANTYAGGTTVDAGTLSLDRDVNDGAGTIGSAA